jgi:hypothetical protein
VTSDEESYSFPSELLLDHEWGEDFFKPVKLVEMYEKLNGNTYGSDWEELLKTDKVKIWLSQNGSPFDSVSNFVKA